MKINNRKFRIVILSTILLIVMLVGAIGWVVWNDSNGVSKIPDSSFSVEVDPNIGGGFMGAVDTYLVTSAGEVYNIQSSDYKTPSTKTLIRKISGQEIQELRNSFIDSGVMELDSGDGPSYSESMWTVIINGTEKVFYDLSSSKFDDPRSKLENIFGTQAFNPFGL